MDSHLSVYIDNISLWIETAQLGGKKELNCLS